MKEYTIQDSQAGIGLHKYLCKILPNASSSFLYKMLRKKNITLNGKKAEGGEKLCSNDVICVYFSEDTLAKFEGDEKSGLKEENVKKSVLLSSVSKIPPLSKDEILYEDDDILALFKQAGELSQKAREGDISINERMLSYLISSGQMTPDDLKIIKPSVCNRLDRNTSGIILCGKSMKGLQSLSKALKDRSAHKYYRAWVKGRIDSHLRCEGYLIKNPSDNKVKVVPKPLSDDYKFICTEFYPIHHSKINNTEVTELEILLVTGRSHQIRAHLSSLGHPLLGDPKYGDMSLNRELAKKYGIKRQLLHSYRTELSEQFVITCPYPRDMIPTEWK